MPKKEIKRNSINLSLKSLHNVYQLSDIHIRNFKRHTEYNYVFERVYETIKQDTSEEFIIVVTGDISHAKTDMSPELIQMISTFLRSLADIAPTFLIAGNHDCNLNNKDRLDVLLPIIELLNHPNLFYLKDTGIYSLPQYDLDFIVFSVFDNPENYFPVSESTASKKICLYHGVVDGCILDNGMAMTTNHMTLDKFIGADITMLGDIHKYQTLQDYKLEELEIDESKLEQYLAQGWQIQ